MAGQEVTFDDVARAAESLQEDGEAVTIEAVQDFLGEGSPNAIFKHLAAWRAANVKPKAPPTAAARLVAKQAKNRVCACSFRCRM